MAYVDPSRRACRCCGCKRVLIDVERVLARYAVGGPSPNLALAASAARLLPDWRRMLH